jgi:multidrug efflux pump subunit AcrA (membrane-fusion protein)
MMRRADSDGRRRGVVRWLVIAVALILAAVAVAATYRTLHVTDSAAGYVQPTQSATLNFAASGRIDTVTVKPGDTVSVGQALATTDSSVARAQLRAAKAQLRADLAQLAELRAAPSTTTPAQISATTAIVEQQRATLLADRNALADTVLTSPTAGVVSSVGGIVGELATPDGIHTFAAPEVPTAQTGGIRLFPAAPQVSQPAQPTFVPMVQVQSATSEVIAQVTERDYPNVQVGQDVTVTFPAVAGLAVTGRVARIEPDAVNQSGEVFYLAHIDLGSSAEDPRIRAGMSADIGF